MTAPSGQFWGGDVFLTTVFPLNSDGSLQAVDENPYEGLIIDGPRTFDLTPAEPGVLVNIGNGRVRDVIYRAPREASRAELRVGYDQLAVKAALTGVNVYQVGEAKIIGRLTNLQGSEVDVSLVAVQQGHDENGLTRYKSYIIPKSKAAPIDSPMNDNALEDRYAVTISNSKKEVWGEAYTVARHGFTETGYLDVITEGRPKIVAWMGDGIEDTFLFPEGAPATSVDKISVWDWTAGIEYTGGGIEKATDQIVFPYPFEGLIVALYEY